MKQNLTALSWFLSFFLRQMMEMDAAEGSEIKAQLTRAIQISKSDFEINSDLPMSTNAGVRSHIECGAIFLADKRNDNSSSGNGFYLDNDSNSCQIGTVTFPVEEIDAGGIFVSGVSEF